MERIRPDEGRLLRRVRLASLLDAPAAFAEHPGESSRHEEAVWTERARRAAAGDETAVFLARRGERVVGLVGLDTPDGARAGRRLFGLWVAHEERRAGVGRRLVHAAVALAVESPAEWVRLWVADGNEPARRLYESLGFRVTGRRRPLPSDTRVEEVEMRLSLREPRQAG